MALRKRVAEQGELIKRMHEENGRLDAANKLLREQVEKQGPYITSLETELIAQATKSIDTVDLETITESEVSAPVTSSTRRKPVKKVEVVEEEVSA